MRKATSKQEARFEDFLSLQTTVIREYYSLSEIKNLLKIEPYSSLTLENLTKLMFAFVDEQEFLWASAVQKEIKRREEFNLM